MAPTSLVEPTFAVGQSIGPLGRWVRHIVGILTIPYAMWDWELLTEPRSWAFYGTVALSLATIFVAYLALDVLLSRRPLVHLNPWLSTAVLIGPPLAILLIPSLGSDAFRLGLVLYLAVSLIALFFVRYGGCEVVALPLLIVGQRRTVYCPWNAIDVVDKVVAHGRTRTITGQDPGRIHANHPDS